MKRWLTFALALVMLLSPLQGYERLALAEAEEEVYSVQVEDAAQTVEDFDIGIPEGAGEAPQEEAQEEAGEQTLADEYTETEIYQKAGADAGIVIGGDLNGIGIGETRTVTVTDANGSPIAPEALSFDVLNGEIAQVNAEGQVTGLKTGATEIIVTYYGNLYSAPLVVSGEPESIRIAAGTQALGKKETAPLPKVEMLPEGAASAITWESSNEKVLRVNAQEGTMYGVKTGKATLTAITNNGKRASLELTVLKAPSKLTVALSASAICVGGQAMILPTVNNGAESATFTYTSSNPAVASVDAGGVITGVGMGSATITAITYNGKKATTQITVSGQPVSVDFAGSRMMLAVGQTSVLEPEVYDAEGNKTSAPMTYEVLSQSGSVVSVDEETGALQGMGLGTAVIRATASNGVTGTVEVEVLDAPRSIALNHLNTILGVKETFTGLKVVLTMADGMQTVDDSATWSTSNQKVVKVNEKTGEIIGVKAGTALITATAYNGMTATCKVTVAKAPTKITLSPETMELSAGGMTGQLSVTFPKKSGCSGIAYHSSDNRVARVDEYGVVTSVGEGKATITARTYNGKTAACNVQVYGEPVSARMNDSELTLGQGQTAKLSATALSSSGRQTMTNFSFFIDDASPDPDCISINPETGEVTALSDGVALVGVYTHNGIEGDGLCEVEVKSAPVAVILPASFTLSVGETVDAIPAQIRYSNGEVVDATELTWTSNKVKYVTVDKDTGALTGIKKGTAKITATTYNGKKATCKVTVAKAEASSQITLSPATLKLAAGGMRFSLKVSGAASGVTFSSSNEKAAVVDEDGVITTVGRGTSVIYARVGGNSASCALTVTDVPARASFADSTVTLSLSQTLVPSVNVTAADGSAAMADLTFKVVSGSSVISLDSETGEIKALKAGTSVVSVQTHNGVVADNTLTVVVKKSASNEEPESETEDPNKNRNSNVEAPAEMVKLGVASYTDTYVSGMSNAEKLEYVIYVGGTQLGMPYVYGGGYKDPDPSGFDCSGFVYWCFYHINIKLGDSAKKQGYDSNYLKVSTIDELKRGDVVCFNTVDDDDLSDHTGIYLGKGYFIHASSAGGCVMISDLSSGYYNRNFSWGRRILS